MNTIYAYDDHIKIIYNTNGKEESISLDEIESSTSFSSSSPQKAGHLNGVLLFVSLYERSNPSRALARIMGKNA